MSFDIFGPWPMHSKIQNHQVIDVFGSFQPYKKSWCSFHLPPHFHGHLRMLSPPFSSAAVLHVSYWTIYYISSLCHHAIKNDCPSWAPHPYLPRHLILWKEHASASRRLISSATASTLSSKASVRTNGQWQAASPHLDVPGSAGKWLVNGVFHLYF